MDPRPLYAVAFGLLAAEFNTSKAFFLSRGCKALHVLERDRVGSPGMGEDGVQGNILADEVGEEAVVEIDESHDDCVY